MPHTPGDWKFRTARNGDCGVYAEGTGIFIEAYAEIRGPGEGATEEAKANAMLVTAAPAMLEALRQMVVNSEGDGKSYRQCHKKAVAAIAKAEGRDNG
jgi:hypothetical protein